MTFQQEFASWFSPSHTSVAKAPGIGDQAPHTSQLQLRSGRAAVITFLRHCGCPWAEKTYLQLRDTAEKNGDVDFIAVSHSNDEHTEEWRKSLPGSDSEPSNIRLIVDEKAEVYAAWGLGTADWMHVVSVPALWEVYKLARDEGIKNRPTRSGSRWQMSGSFGVDGDGVVRWGRPMTRADEILDFGEAVEKVKAGAGEASTQSSKL